MASDDQQGPAFRYYHALEGAWTGVMTLTVGDPAAFARLPANLRVLARLGASTRMSTTLAHASGREFLHTTRVSLWGLPLASSRERMLIDSDGRTGRMPGEDLGFLRRARAYEATLEIDESATRATYHIPWAGFEFVQRTQIVPEGLELTQELPGLRISVLLSRRAPGRPREPRAPGRR